MRQLSQPERNIKAATARSIRQAGGLEAAALFVRVGKTSLANYYNINETECFVPIDVALHLDELAGYPHITEAMTAAVNLPVRKQQDPHGLLASLLKEAGELGSVVAQALEDGTICPREASAIIKEATDLKEACQRLIDMASTVQARAVA